MKIGLISLGCPKNLVDSEVMLGLARQAGHEVTTDTADADVLVVNTCAFVDGAKQESVDAILEMAQAKSGDRPRRLVVAGCLAERYRDELKAEIPEIDAVLGTGQVTSIVEAIEGRAPAAPAPMQVFRRGVDGSAAPAVLQGIASRHRAAAAAGTLPTYIYEASTPRVLTTPRHFAYVKVAEGCDYNCSFCIIPVLRGQYRSRPVDDIVAEARHLADGGVKELILISQDTTFYGTDRKERGALARLIESLTGVDGLEWIRLLYLYPTTITDDVLDAMRRSPKVCRYVDLPLQHSAASVLQRMRRPGHGATYERLLERIRERLPGVTLRTTFIVGFPGETDDEFADLEGFLRRVGFDHVGVFTYSHEEGTAAYGLADDVPPAVKAKRRDRLMRLQKRIVERRHARLRGQHVAVLVDGPSPEHDLIVQGRLTGQAPEIDPVCYFTEADPALLAPGAVVQAEVVESRGYDLVVRPLAGATEAAEAR
jgi:ribosomal protein S12 methylthiotransferase